MLKLQPHIAVLTIILCLELLRAPSARADDVAARLKDYLEVASKNDGCSGAVIVTKDGMPLLCGGYGQANIEFQIPNTPQTKFRLGSITKQFTAMAVMILQERGKLRVEDPISKYVDDTPKAWEGITIRHLLTHTSGIPSYTGFPQMMSRTVRLPATVDEVIATFKDKELEFQPGEKFAYSNSGYHVLGKIIERAAGQDYETFLREAILQPLEMNDTGYDHNESILPRRASGYLRGPDGLLNAPYIHMSWPYAAGALYSTVEDLARWDQALAAGKLIGPESYQAMFTPLKGDYAYGWRVRDRGGHKEISHGGGIHGFSTAIIRYPDDQLCVVVLNNIIPTRSERIALDLAGIALGEIVAPPAGR